MPIRIYALAKELNIENKELVDICTKAGISGKGSALASLSDDEVSKVKEFISGAGKAAAVGLRSASTTTRVAAPMPTRSDVVAPRGTSKIKVLEKKPKKTADAVKKEESEAPKAPPKKDKEQVIRLAEMPEVKQPAEKAKSDEPRIQKPDIALPKDAIAGARKSKTAPLAEFTQAHKKAKEQESRVGEPAGETPLSGRAASKSRRRPKIDDDDDKPPSRMGNLREERTKRRKSRTQRSVEGDDEPIQRDRRRLQRQRGQRKSTAAPRKERVTLTLPCTVRSFSEATGIPAVQVCFSLANLTGANPAALNINTRIDEESAHVIAEELGVEQIQFKAHESLEESILAQIRDREVDPELLQARPPVVTFLGHVDHGKTSLLDKILGINVVSGEAGGITQHIRAYAVDKDGRKVSFVDTPGHAAFTEMRARGANVTDIAVLVVAADDGIMPQTEEAISHAKAAGVPIVVAANKMDLPGADMDKVLQQLAAHELLPSSWGGDIEVAPTSALTGEGIDELLETLLVTAELHEYKANPKRDALGVCLEAEQEPGRGVIAKLIVQDGTLKVGDIIVCGRAHGRVKAMYDTLRPNRKVKSAGPSVPVNVTGLDWAPDAGDAFYVLDDIGLAREIAAQREHRSREQSLSGHTVKVSFEEFQRRLEEGRIGRADEVVMLNLIVRADVRGSIEAILKEFEKLHHPEVQIKVLQATVGGITAADVTLAHASQAVIIGFNVIPDDGARILADQRGVEIRRYDIIYKVTDDIRALLEGKLKPEERFVELGNALVKEVFQISRSGTVAGCHVTAGSIQRGCRVRVHRDGRTIGEYALESLKRHKDDVKEVPRGMECGMKLAGFDDVKVGDVLEAYKIEEVARTLDA